MKKRALTCFGLLAVSTAAGAPVDFASEVRPILAKHCYACHGAEKQKAGLRLDRKADALLGGDSGKVIVAGKSAESVLFKAIAGLDPELMMPPEDEERLSAKDVATLKAWIDAGATWPDGADAGMGGEGGEVASGGARVKSKHWAFAAPLAADVPRVDAAKVPAGWGRSPIDAFVLERMTRDGVAPSREAERTTLVRRLSFDLRGLPPTPEEVREFVGDGRTDAYERLVERMLESRHFGERWGRHWLDLARYADSDGYEKDSPRPHAYLFRDWVIDAINRDVPFDQFTIEQLAGDLLPGATNAQKVATGFHRQTLTNKEGGVDKEEFRTKAVVDRVSTTGAVWLGLTVGCAECHTHKFDPITQREFYQLYSFFNDASEADIPMPQASEVEAFARKMKAWEPKAKELEGALGRRAMSVGEAVVKAWEERQVVPTAKWTVVRPIKATIAVGDGETVLTPARDGTVTTRLRSTTRGRWVLEATTTLKRVTGFRVEAVEEAGRAIGRGPGGDFSLGEFSVSVKPKGGESRRLRIAAAKADFASAEGGAEKTIDGNPETGWSVGPQTEQSHVIVFELGESVDLAEGMTFVVELDQSAFGVMNRFRVGITGSALPLEPSTLPDAMLAILRLPHERRTGDQSGEVMRYYAERVDEEGRKLRVALEAHTAKKPAAPATTAAVMVAEERKTHVHVRGDFLRKGDEVQPGTLGVLHELKARGARPDRLDLARWLVDPANPLTARVAVNHVWKNLFGRALVGTVDDFGTRGEAPLHPELLDWLAVAFAAKRELAVGADASERRPYLALGWSRKELIRLIVNSAAYRQDSRVRADVASRDPNNGLLARQNRFRLEAEVVRDAFLATSGLLNPAVGGPSIRPQLPADIAALGYANSVKWTESAGDEKYRRGMYIFFQRTVPYPMLMTFDAPDSNVACTRRERSNTPLQALTTLNDPVFFECAQALGRGVAKEMPDATAEARVRWVFERCVSRAPSAAEMARLTEFYRGQLEMLRRTPESAEKVAGAGDMGDAVEVAALVAVARIVMNLDEFLTRE